MKPTCSGPLEASSGSGGSALYYVVVFGAYVALSGWLPTFYHPDVSGPGSCTAAAPDDGDLHLPGQPAPAAGRLALGPLRPPGRDLFGVFLTMSLGLLIALPAERDLPSAWATTPSVWAVHGPALRRGLQPWGSARRRSTSTSPTTTRTTSGRSAGWSGRSGPRRLLPAAPVRLHRADDGLAPVGLRGGPGAHAGQPGLAPRLGPGDQGGGTPVAPGRGPARRHPVLTITGGAAAAWASRC